MPYYELLRRKQICQLRYAEHVRREEAARTDPDSLTNGPMVDFIRRLFPLRLFVAFVYKSDDRINKLAISRCRSAGSD